MEWTRSDTLALANQRCTTCRGIGLKGSNKEVASPCNCVLRAIFRICLERFIDCVTQERRFSQVRVERRPGKLGHITYARKDEEYLADFTKVAERTLTKDEYKIFRYHFLLGADYSLCCRQLKVDKGTFFHAIYRIEQKLGRVFRELEPYPLFPLDEYFGGTVRNDAHKARIPAFTLTGKLSDLVPLKNAA